MKFDPPLIPARLIRRYKRFLADVTLDDGKEVTVAVANTGSMMGLTAPGSKVWLSTSPNPNRKYPNTWEIVEADGTLVGVNTNLPNRLTEEAIRAELIDDLHTYPELKREQRYGENSRIDILLGGDARPPAYVEVKNVHMRRHEGLAEFPDTVTARGAKHLAELARMKAAGCRAIMIYLIQRADCERFSLCGDLDPAYTAAFAAAKTAGVEAYAVRCQISCDGIVPECVIPFDD